MEEGGGLVLDCESSFNNNSLFQFSSDIDVGATPNLSEANVSSLDNEGLPTELHVLFQLPSHPAPFNSSSLSHPGDDPDTSLVTNGAPNIQYSISPPETNRIPLSSIARLRCPQCTQRFTDHYRLV